MFDNRMFDLICRVGYNDRHVGTGSVSEPLAIGETSASPMCRIAPNRQWRSCRCSSQGRHPLAICVCPTRLLYIAAIVSCAGCADPDDPYGRLALSGTITFEGQPLDEGLIDFLPAESGRGAGARAMIRDGRYTIPSHQGVTPGTYRVVITSAEPIMSQPTDGTPAKALPLPGKERIPPEFNTESQHTIEATAGDENSFDFTIP